MPAAADMRLLLIILPSLLYVATSKWLSLQVTASKVGKKTGHLTGALGVGVLWNILYWDFNIEPATWHREAGCLKRAVHSQENAVL